MAKYRVAGSVSYELNDDLKSQLSKVIKKAKSQLESYEIDNNAEKIAFILIEK